MKHSLLKILLLLPVSVHAHHGIANFDLNRDLELTGIVKEVEFMNPHSWLHLDVTNADGSITSWRCEMRGATVLRRSGWSPDMFQAGMQLSISGSPDRKDPRTCYTATINFPDGSSVNRYGQLTRPNRADPGDRPRRLASGVPNFAGDWAAEQLVMTDPRGIKGMLVPISMSDQYEPGESPTGVGFPGARGTEISMKEDPVDAYWNRRPTSMPLTPAGEAAIADLDFSTGDNPRLRCAPTNILFDWYFEMDVNRIVQTQDQLKMYYGSMGIERTIHLGMTEHPATIEPSVAGHSIGRWEGDELVIDTIGFKPGILNADGRVPHSDALHVVERFSLDPERFALRRSYVATDPNYYNGEFSGSDTMYVSDLPYHGTTECEDRTYRQAEAPQAVEAQAQTEKEDSPWWRFWD